MQLGGLLSKVKQREGEKVKEKDVWSKLHNSHSRTQNKLFSKSKLQVKYNVKKSKKL